MPLRLGSTAGPEHHHQRLNYSRNQRSFRPPTSPLLRTPHSSDHLLRTLTSAKRPLSYSADLLCANMCCSQLFHHRGRRCSRGLHRCSLLYYARDPCSCLRDAGQQTLSLAAPIISTPVSLQTEMCLSLLNVVIQMLIQYRLTR